MFHTLREQVEDVVRGLLAADPTARQSMPSETIQQPASPMRRDLCAQVVALREQQEQELLPLRVEAARLELSLSEVLAHAEGLKIHLGNVRGREFVLGLKLSAERDRVVAALMESASPLITNFIAEMNTEFDALRRLTPKEGRGVGQLDPITMIKPKYAYSNRPAITRRVLAVLAARKRAEELKTIDRSDLELAKEFESLRAGLPTIDGELEQVIGD